MSEKKGIEFFKSTRAVTEVLLGEESPLFWQVCVSRPTKKPKQSHRHRRIFPSHKNDNKYPLLPKMTALSKRNPRRNMCLQVKSKNKNHFSRKTNRSRTVA
jgi:hypothetical protein